jgi:catechol 2,3-dioxygenase-like lactoylglutathione lyase family enzyme
MRTESPARTALSAISPLFVVSDLQRALTFYRERLGFEVTHQAPAPDPFFAIVARDGVQLMLKVVAEGVGALPNRSRHPHARWDAYVHVPDPDALAAELRDRGVTFSAPLADTDDGLRGFELTDHDGYLLFFGRPASDAY